MAARRVSPRYLDGFGGDPTPRATQVLTLPSHRDFTTPVLDSDLWDATDDVIDKPMGSLDEASFALGVLYERVAHPTLDDLDNVANNTRLDAWKCCHNGLGTARAADWLESEEIYHLTERLMTWIQDQPAARLGPRDSRNWWIVPEIYALHVRDSRDKTAEQPWELGSPVVSAHDQVAHPSFFDLAKFTVHFVHCAGDHWAIIIYQPDNGDSWYLDSLGGPTAKRRGPKARRALLDWLERSQRPAPAGGRHYTPNPREQEDGWSCGLHAIANTMAFLRFEVLGWQNIPLWENVSARGMRKQLLVCLHHLMSQAFVPSDTPGGSPQQQRVTTPRRVTTPSGSPQQRRMSTPRRVTTPRASPQQRRVTTPSGSPQQLRITTPVAAAIADFSQAFNNLQAIAQASAPATTPSRSPAAAVIAGPQPGPAGSTLSVPFGLLRAPRGKTLVDIIRKQAERDAASRNAGRAALPRTAAKGTGKPAPRRPAPQPPAWLTTPLPPGQTLKRKRGASVSPRAAPKRTSPRNRAAPLQRTQRPSPTLVAKVAPRGQTAATVVPTTQMNPGNLPSPAPGRQTKPPAVRSTVQKTAKRKAVDDADPASPEQRQSTPKKKRKINKAGAKRTRKL